ncbi:hypothetical protein M8C21_005272, partial [Ambrosia artemisiifolia]
RLLKDLVVSRSSDGWGSFWGDGVLMMVRATVGVRLGDGGGDDGGSDVCTNGGVMMVVVFVGCLHRRCSTIGAIIMTPLLTKLLAGQLVPVDAAHDDPGPSRGKPSDDEEGGQTSIEASDDSDADLSGAGKSDDDESSVKAHKDKVQTRAKKGKQAIPVYDVSSSSPVRITRSKARVLEISTEKPRAKNVRPTKANKRKRAEKSWNDGLEPRKQRNRSKLNEWLGIRTRSSPTQFTSLKDNILDYLTDDLDFAGLDWCELVVEVLRSCKNGWRRDSLDPPFTGPLTFLTLLYVDSFKCKGIDIDSSVIPMSFWTFQRLD